MPSEWRHTRGQNVTTDIFLIAMLKEGIRCLNVEVRRIERFREAEIALGNKEAEEVYAARISGLHYCLTLLEDEADK